MKTLDHSKCSYSTSICGHTTAGQGKLDYTGEWQIPCDHCLETLNKQSPDINYKERSWSENCGHIAIVSINETECQCMDCLRKWKKEPGFKSDYPMFDRG